MKIKNVLTTSLALAVALLSAANIYIRQPQPRTAPTDGYIKWVEFGASEAAMHQAYKLDVQSAAQPYHLTFTQSLAYLGTKYGGDFSRYKQSDLESLYKRLCAGESFEEITSQMKNYTYFREAYGAVTENYVGEYEQDGEKKYGLKVFSPIARGYYYGDFDDFGASRSYGYKRRHLGHDLTGTVGTPIVAVESGYVEAVGWNMYGGWRVGIRSFDGKRYYYYAHLRKNHPYNDMYEGKIVIAGEVIGYLGMTGYSQKENVNNIDTPHLHFGIQLIFDKSQKEAVSEIWIDAYQICKFLQSNKSAVQKRGDEYYASSPITDPCVPD